MISFPRWTEYIRESDAVLHIVIFRFYFGLHLCLHSLFIRRVFVDNDFVLDFLGSLASCILH